MQEDIGVVLGTVGWIECVLVVTVTSLLLGLGVSGAN